MLGYWRSVGASMRTTSSTRLSSDELADKGEQDPYELRMRLLQGNDRLTTLLRAASELSGGWKRGPFTAEDGTRRARGVAMAAAFGTGETAAIAEVSIANALAGQVCMTSGRRSIRAASSIPPSSIAQVNGAVALALWWCSLEEAAYEKACRSPVTTTSIRSCRLTEWYACT